MVRTIFFEMGKSCFSSRRTMVGLYPARSPQPHFIHPKLIELSFERIFIIKADLLETSPSHSALVSWRGKKKRRRSTVYPREKGRICNNGCIFGHEGKMTPGNIYLRESNGFLSLWGGERGYISFLPPICWILVLLNKLLEIVFEHAG